MKVSEIQKSIFDATGLKTSAKRNKGSMKDHITIWPIYQDGKYPLFPIDWIREFSKQFKAFGEAFTYASSNSLDIPSGNITEFDPIKYKKESKPKEIDPNKPQKGWGSKNSQIRLDKAIARNAKKLRNGNTARYY